MGFADAALGRADGAQHKKRMGLAVPAFVASGVEALAVGWLAIAAAECRLVDTVVVVRITLGAQASGGQSTGEDFVEDLFRHRCTWLPSLWGLEGPLILGH
jgi:hypothetical protein